MTETTRLFTEDGAGPTGGAAAAGNRRRPFRDNPRLILLGIVLLLVALVVLVRLAEESAEIAPRDLSEAVLYALSATCLTMLVLLAFVLARNLLKLWVERRRAVPFARFRAKLVAAMLGMTLVPSLLVLLVGSELIRSSVARWSSAPVDAVLASATEVARDYYQSVQADVADEASRLGERLTGLDADPPDAAALRALVEPDVAAGRVDTLDVYRVITESSVPRLEPLLQLPARGTAGPADPAASIRLAERALAGTVDARSVDRATGAVEVARAGVRIHGEDGASVVGIVVAGRVVPTEVARHSREISGAYEAYNQFRVLRRPLGGVYLSFFVMISLMILISAAWMGVYIAKRITRPVQRLAEGARQIGAGRLDHRIEPETGDEFGTLVEAFNAMAGDLSTSHRKLERSRVDLERKNQEVERRRRYFEMILERIATGVVSIDATGRVSTLNAAAARLLDLDGSAIGQPAGTVFDRPDLAPLAAALRNARAGSPERTAQEVALVQDGREVHLAVAATALPGDGGDREGAVMVLDDVTPLIRAQRVATWRDVARRLAHEIKNPLTPIQLCAERLQRHFSAAPPRARALVDECTTTIVGEVEALKGLVDEFSQFARMPSPRTVPANLNQILADTLALYEGLFKDVAIQRSFASHLPQVKVDPEQIRRIVVNLVDNALDAIRGAMAAAPNGARGVIVVETLHDASHGLVRLIVRDDGPGIPAADRDKLFMPYFSTKRRGSGLGLAIVRRIVVEHGGTIDVSENEPTGTRFTIELPC